MNKIVVVGIGGAGSAIVEYIAQECSTVIQLCILDSDTTPRTATVPIHYFSEQQLSSPELFQEFLQKNITGSGDHFLFLSGFVGKNSEFILKNCIEFCNSAGKQCSISGVTPFRFEGKKVKEAEALIGELQECSAAIAPYSNSDLLETIDPATPLEQAMKINYQKIYDELVAPHIPSTPDPTNVTQAEVFHFPKAWYQTGTAKVAGIILGFLMGIALTLAGTALF